MGQILSIEGFEELYAISEAAEIIHVKYNRILKINYSTPYPSICLCKDNFKYQRSVHRLLALAFIPNPENKPHINHKNGNKKDFSLSNLEWTTPSENCKHAYDTGLAKVSDKCKAVLSETHSGANHYNHKKVINVNTGEIYDTIRQAAKANNIKAQTLHRQLHNQKGNKHLQFYNN